jgi:hypothetical protein
MSNFKPDTKGRYYKLFANKWQKIAAILGGEEVIKESGSTYCPKLSGQDATEYQAYIDRGTFFNAFARTVSGMTGAIIRKEPTIKTVETVNKLLSDVTLYGESIQEVIKIVINGVLQSGYYGILIDMPVELVDGASPYFSLYAPTSILNFRTVKVGSEYKLIMLALLELISENSPDNSQEEITIERIRILIIEEGGLVVRLYRKTKDAKKEDWVQEGKDILPTIRGKRLQDIPFVFFGSLSNTPIPDEPPLMDLANLNIKHWQLTVDYYHGLHYCAIPTPWAAGFGKSTDLYIGANKAWVSDDPNAQCGYLEFTGQGLAAILAAIDKLENQMAIIGARMLEEQKKAAEAADTVRMRYSGDSASLSNIVDCAEQGIVKAINWLGTWLGLTDIKTEVALNRDFVAMKLDAQMLTALIGALQSGSISQDTFLYNMQLGELLPADRTIADEKILIKESFSGMMENEEVI